MNAMQMLEHYKDNGERVDEVLFNQISKEFYRLRAVIDQKNYSIDLIGDQKVQAQKDNKHLREALEYYANHENYEYEEERDVGGHVHRIESTIQLDCGETARKALEGDSK